MRSRWQLTLKRKEKAPAGGRHMAKITRREAREAVFKMAFEYDFDRERDVMELYGTALAERELVDDKYMRSVFFGIAEKLPELDALIEENAKGWKKERISKVATAILRLAIYEMLYTEIPYTIAINEALEISKIYDDDGAKAFINGILNSVAVEKGLKDQV